MGLGLTGSSGIGLSGTGPKWDQSKWDWARLNGIGRTLPTVPERRLVSGAHEVDRPLALVRQVAERRLKPSASWAFVCLFASVLAGALFGRMHGSPWCPVAHAPTRPSFRSAVRQ